MMSQRNVGFNEPCELEDWQIHIWFNRILVNEDAVLSRGYASPLLVYQTVCTRC